MALSAGKLRNSRGTRIGTLQAAIVTAAQVYLGSCVVQLSAGGRLSPTKGANRHVAGVVISLDKSGSNGNGTGLGDTAGTQLATVAYGDEHEFTIATAIRTNSSLGLNVFFSDDDTVGGTAVGTGGVQKEVGELISFSNSAKSLGYVAVRRFCNDNIAV